MKILVYILFGSMLLGQFGAFPLAPNVTLYAHDVVIILLVFASLFRPSAWQTYSRQRVFAPVVAFAAAGLLSLLVNAARFSASELLVSGLYWVRWVVYAMLPAVVFDKRVLTKHWWRGLMLFGVSLAVIGLGQLVLYPDLRNLLYAGWDPHYQRVFSTLLDPNFTGIILVVTVWVLGYWAQKTTRERWILISGLVVVLALLLTYSRSSYLALAAGLLHRKLGSKQKKPWVVMALVSLVVIVYAAKFAPDALRLDRFDSAAARLGNWQQSMGLARSRPILGHGFNTLRFVGEAPERAMFPLRAGAGVDSSLLFVFVTTGLVGLCAYLWLLWVTVRTCIGLVKNHATRSLGMLFFATLISLLVHSVFVNSLFYPWVMIVFWVIVGLVAREATMENR